MFFLNIFSPKPYETGYFYMHMNTENMNFQRILIFSSAEWQSIILLPCLHTKCMNISEKILETHYDYSVPAGLILSPGAK